MKRLRLIGAAALLACASSAFASSFVVTTDTLVRATGMTSNATSDITNSFRDDKIVLEARDDAASFVASQGDIRGSHRSRTAPHPWQAAEPGRQRHATGPGDPDHLSRLPAAAAARLRR